MEYNNLERYENQGLELFINTETGEAFASQSALSRMCEVEDSTIKRWRTVAQIEVKNAEVPTDTGLKTSALYDEDAILKAFEKYNTKLLITCAKAGLRVYLHRLAGFEVSSSAVNTKETIDPTDKLDQKKIIKVQAMLIDLAEKEKECDLLINQYLDAKKNYLELDFEIRQRDNAGELTKNDKVELSKERDKFKEIKADLWFRYNKSNKAYDRMVREYDMFVFMNYHLISLAPPMVFSQTIKNVLSEKMRSVIA